MQLIKFLWHSFFVCRLCKYCSVLFLHCTVLYCNVFHCVVLYLIALYCIVFYCIVLYCTVLFCFVFYFILFYCYVFYCFVFVLDLYCIAFPGSRAKRHQLRWGTWGWDREVLLPGLHLVPETGTSPSSRDAVCGCCNGTGGSAKHQVPIRPHFHCSRISTDINRT